MTSLFNLIIYKCFFCFKVTFSSSLWLSLQLPSLLLIFFYVKSYKVILALVDQSMNLSEICLRTRVNVYCFYSVADGNNSVEDEPATDELCKSSLPVSQTQCGCWVCFVLSFINIFYFNVMLTQLNQPDLYNYILPVSCGYEYTRLIARCKDQRTVE